MGHFLATIYDLVTAPVEQAGLARWRAELLSPLSGDVLEIGAGTGLNLPHYPAAVARLVLTEPDAAMRRRLARKVRASGRAHVQVAEAPASPLPFPSASFDAVVSTLVLCSVDSPAAALDEIRRVLKRGGRFVFIEHVAARDRPRRLRWQRRLEPLWKIVAGNCHVTRDTEQAIRDAGFEFVHIARGSMRKAAPILRPTIRGVALRPPLSSRAERAI